MDLDLKLAFWARDFFFSLSLSVSRVVGLVGEFALGLCGLCDSFFSGHVAQLCWRLLTLLGPQLSRSNTHSLALLIKSYTKSQRTAPQVD